MKSIFVSICGAPNAGKSTLVNLLVGQKVSIVSPKVQTTRDVIRGIVTEGDTQIVFLDTPGVFKPKRDLEKTIVRNAHSGIRDGELACLVVDAKVGLCQDSTFILHELKQKAKKTVVILNKTDTVKDHELIKLLGDVFDSELMEEIFPVSAKTGTGVDKLKSFLIGSASEDVWYYDPKDSTDRSIGFVASEMTREKLFMALKEELPYNLCVTTEEIFEDKGLLCFSQTIYVHKQNQKNIVIGKGGSMIARVVKESSIEMTNLLGRPVKIAAFVKVRENWMSGVELL